MDRRGMLLAAASVVSGGADMGEKIGVYSCTDNSSSVGWINFQCSQCSLSGSNHYYAEGTQMATIADVATQNYRLPTMEEAQYYGCEGVPDTGYVNQRPDPFTGTDIYSISDDDLVYAIGKYTYDFTNNGITHYIDIPYAIVILPGATTFRLGQTLLDGTYDEHNISEAYKTETTGGFFSQTVNVPQDWSGGMVCLVDYHLSDYDYRAFLTKIEIPLISTD